MVLDLLEYQCDVPPDFLALLLQCQALTLVQGGARLTQEPVKISRGTMQQLLALAPTCFVTHESVDAHWLVCPNLTQTATRAIHGSGRSVSKELCQESF